MTPADWIWIAGYACYGLVAIAFGTLSLAGEISRDPMYIEKEGRGAVFFGLLLVAIFWPAFLLYTLIVEAAKRIAGVTKP